jgi:hypothetical protein
MSAKETLKQKLRLLLEDEDIQNAIHQEAGVWAGLINVPARVEAFIERQTEYKAAQLLHRLRE